MEIVRINSNVTAFIRTVEGVNAGLLHTPGGLILIDTTSSPAEAKSLIDAVGASVSEVSLVINTHSHSDHTWGNQVFSCPILAHRSCQELMKAAITDYWSPKSLRSYLASLKKTDPGKAQELRLMISDLHITLPNMVFDESYQGESGGFLYEVIHLGGHTPDLSVVWLPESRVLFASDLIFQGRYPYIYDADIPAWIDRLDRLQEFGAAVIVPGHGVICGQSEIVALQMYLQDTWDLTAEHIRKGHSPSKTATDPAFPIFHENKYERLHKANIRYMYKQLSR